ncbi:MAG: slipin family protein [Actinobacteria bacterium]|jgi:regulator of protease activity HflC (stomatin/prohibitin superfamily)|nr:slipin family protein [Actinomycetota bacterium]
MLVGPTVAIIFGIIFVLILLLSAVKILREYERGVIFRFGRLSATKGPGIFLIIPFVDKMIKVDLRTVTMDVPPQDIITRDNVPVKVNAVIYFRVMDPALSVIKIERYIVATSQIAQTTLRSILGQAELDDLLARREKINQELQKVIDEQTDPWGIKVSIVEIKDVELPQSIQRAFARQAEAERERRAKIINAEGEFQASEKLAEAAKVLSKHPVSVQLRFLQTLKEIATEQNSTIIFPVPIDLIEVFINRLGKK